MYISCFLDDRHGPPRDRDHRGGDNRDRRDPVNRDRRDYNKDHR